MIFELVLFGIILLAVGYWATMFVMGRRDDVLHGKFVEPQAGPEPTFATPPQPPARPMPVPPQPSKDSLQTLLTVIKRDLQDVARS